VKDIFHNPKILYFQLFEAGVQNQETQKQNLIKNGKHRNNAHGTDLPLF
jgi:hypothetical protein